MKFHERTRELFADGQIICRGMMDMGDYDEKAMVVIAQGKAVAYVEDKVMEINL